ncbi:uncharacterized protein LAESUDRAFT_730894 [Laetiporus sulphureus 93-53]|uniref:Uncharacterized protein n=1 Tax=Laetiporus sulphureus 93-53 TaxID=1314785 RepID=A0A165BX63_9APHY|nr:uncharacterized protein LAESUDRAFT_730894 [Laetiporus sulphureus 93-53]KZT01813.1 hypothetical protein LAESUDRAFT_730894 [Laetiporus sulphureus 93-53]
MMPQKTSITSSTDQIMSSASAWTSLASSSTASTAAQSSATLATSSDTDVSSSATSPLPSTSHTLSSSSSSMFSHSSSSPSHSVSSANSSSSAYVSNASTSGSSSHTASFYAGVAFAGITVIAFLVAMVSWWLRSRNRTKRRTVADATSWPWEKDTSQRDVVTQDQLEIGANDALRSEYGASGTRYGIDFFHDIPLGDDHASPFHALTSQPSDSSNTYPTVRLNGANCSVPDLAPNMGTLQVANFAPGDLSSGSSDEASRASTALGMAPISRTVTAESGAPYDPMVRDRPRFLGLDGNGLAVPWAPLQPGRQHSSASQIMRADGISEKDIETLPYPGDAYAIDQGSGGWAASFRFNIINAFHAVVSAGGAGEQLDEDRLTYSYLRKLRGGRESRGATADVNVLSRTSTVHSNISDGKEWTTDGVDSIPRLAHVHLSTMREQADTIPVMPAMEQVQRPPAALVKDTDRSDNSVTASGQQLGGLARADSMYSSSLLARPSGRIRPDPPRLPSIPSMSLSPTISSSARAEQSNRKSTRMRRRKKTRAAARPVVIKRASSSFFSVGSDMSRQSSVRSEHLTDAEQFAKRMLRERRRRVMEMGIGRKRTTVRDSECI